MEADVRVRTIVGAALVAFAGQLAGASPIQVAGRQAERLDRGVVAVPGESGGVLVSWRLLASDPAGVGFHIYRDGRRLTAAPVSAATSFVDREGRAGARYRVRPVAGGREGAWSGTAVTWATGYLEIPLDQPRGGTLPDGTAFTYNANDASVGDLDGDGSYELVLKWDPSSSKDNAFSGYSGNTLVDAYTLDGRRLWRLDLGPNIRAGAHYTQFLVYDLDGDGRAEVVMKTADGTIDGRGRVIGNPKADWRERGGEVSQTDRTGSVERPDGRRVAPLTGRILKGPEFLTVFDGRTGSALATSPYQPPRDPGTLEPTTEALTARWGDGYGNRSDRFLAGVAYLDGRRPSIVMGRGYYARSTVAAWDYRNGKLRQRWLFDSSLPGNERFGGQGNHQLSVADLDGDGRDEVVYGSMALDDDGRGLWSSGLGHGDAMHLSDLDPQRPGLEKWGVHENVKSNGGIGSALLDARTGQVLWSRPADRDTGRGLAADIDPRHPGTEVWGLNAPELFDVRGQVAAPQHPRQANFAIWWDGDLLRELLDGTKVFKWDWRAGESRPLLAPEGVASNNGTKSNPTLQADILGDWREEVVWRAADNRSLRIYATPHATTHRFTTLMHDPVYRLGVAWQNVAYNQPPHTSFFLGEGMERAR